jgi:hypothetical protein
MTSHIRSGAATSNAGPAGLRSWSALMIYLTLAIGVEERGRAADTAVPWTV